MRPILNILYALIHMTIQHNLYGMVTRRVAAAGDLHHLPVVPEDIQ